MARYLTSQLIQDFMLHNGLEEGRLARRLGLDEETVPGIEEAMWRLSNLLVEGEVGISEFTNPNGHARWRGTGGG